MITIKNFPLLNAHDCANLFSSNDVWSGYYFLKPIYTELPDFEGWDESEINDHPHKSLKKDTYLVGLEIISDKWVNKGFCASLLENYGLVLDESHPMVQKEDYGDKCLIHLSFEHIILGGNRLKITFDQKK